VHKNKDILYWSDGVYQQIVSKCKDILYCRVDLIEFVYKNNRGVQKYKDPLYCRYNLMEFIYK
jgi:hypothetical protein